MDQTQCRLQTKASNAPFADAAQAYLQDADHADSGVRSVEVPETWATDVSWLTLRNSWAVACTDAHEDNIDRDEE